MTRKRPQRCEPQVRICYYLQRFSAVKIEAREYRQNIWFRNMTRKRPQRCEPQVRICYYLQRFSAVTTEARPRGGATAGDEERRRRSAVRPPQRWEERPLAGSLAAPTPCCGQRICKPGVSFDRCHNFAPSGFLQDRPDRRYCDRGHQIEASGASKRRVCDRGHTFEASKRSPLEPKSRCGSASAARSAIGVTLLNPPDEPKSQICDRGHTFESSR